VGRERRRIRIEMEVFMGAPGWVTRELYWVGGVARIARGAAGGWLRFVKKKRAGLREKTGFDFVGGV
jgi:hypothetical protein